MNAAAFVKGKSETVALLPPATLYQLAAPGAPTEIVEKVIAADITDARAIDTELEKYRLKQLITRKPRRAPVDFEKEQRRTKRRERLERAQMRAEAEAEAKLAAQLASLIDLIHGAGLAEPLDRVLSGDYRLTTVFRRMVRDAASRTLAQPQTTAATATDGANRGMV